MDHSHTEDQLWGAVEILPQRLYYAPLKFFPADDTTTSPTFDSTSKKKIHYFSIDNELIYWNFFLDYGPLNLGQLHRFSSILNSKLSNPEYKNDIICYYSSAKGEARSNATFLICAWSMLYLGRSLEDSYFGFREEFYVPSEGKGSSGKGGGQKNGNTSLPPQLRLRNKQRSNSNDSISSDDTTDGDENPSPFARVHPLPPFHDASPIVCTYDLTVYDCLQGLDKARQLNFFKFDNIAANQPPSTFVASTSETDTSKPYSKPPRKAISFNVEEYEYFEQVENGDLNWLVRDKILAFAGPQAQKLITPEGFCMLTPADYIPYFMKQNVKLVIRLNKKCYEESDFEKVGIDHVEHYYLDGSCPPLEILHAVVSDMESIEDDQAMAVHCKAGLGRTGTCIGAYLMKHYRLTAAEVIGWMRICRPGMVIGPQQHFLADIEGMMWQEGETYRGQGLLNMSMADSSDEDEEEEGEEEDADGDKKMSATSMATPPKGSIGVSLVTPEGQQIDLPSTPVTSSARKLDAAPSSSDGATAMDISGPPDIEQLVASSASPDMKEGDQANALLSRRLDQARARQQSK